MKERFAHALVLVLTIAMVAVLLPILGTDALAQGGCKKFQALVQASLPSPLPLVSPDDPWGGPIYASLDGEFLSGNMSGTQQGTSHGNIGLGRDTQYKVCLGGVVPNNCTDSFTYEAVNANWPVPPGKVGMGLYQSNSAKIVQGTGRFQNATGNLNVAGPWIVWTPDGQNYYGRWNGEISGNVCGAE